MKSNQKFLHVVSVLVAVFVVFTFYLLGGGTGATAQETEGVPTEQGGLNLDVPVADAQELSANRLEAVLKEAEAESEMQRTQRMQQASSFQWMEKATDTPQEGLPAEGTLSASASVPAKPAAPASAPSIAHTEQEKQTFIAQTRQRLAQKYGVEIDEPAPQTNPQVAPQAVAPQPPSKASASVRIASSDGFYGLEEPTTPSSDIRAVVHGEHRNLSRGAIVKLRLLDAIEINHTVIPANTFLYGQLSFTSCRAIIRIQNIQYHNAVYPFEGTIYDKDGFEGLYVPDNKIDEATRKAGSQALANANLRLPATSVISSAANAVVGAVQSVAQQSVAEQKINISSNYLVTIKQTSR